MIAGIFSPDHADAVHLICSESSSVILASMTEGIWALATVLREHISISRACAGCTQVVGLRQARPSLPITSELPDAVRDLLRPSACTNVPGHAAWRLVYRKGTCLSYVAALISPSHQPPF